MTLAVLIPAFNDVASLARTLRALGEQVGEAGAVTVFLVDDGSEPPIAPESLPRTNLRIVFARHPLNLGQGAALETARQLALREQPFDAYVTMDADGQHRAEDVLALAEAIGEGADVAFGNRFLGDSNVPRVRAAILRAARVFEWALTGLRLADAHNGLRGFSPRALSRIAIHQNRMAHATEIKQQVSRAEGPLVVVEVPVTVRYTLESLARGQTSLGAVVILRDLLLQYLFGEHE